MIKRETVARKAKRINDYFDRVEEGRYTGLKIAWATDQIFWLWQFGHLSRREFDQLTKRAVYIIETYRPE